MLGAVAFSGASAQEPDAVEALSRVAVFGDGEDIDRALTALRLRGKPDVAASLILALRYNRSAQRKISATLAVLTGHRDATDWFDWMLWQEAHPEYAPHVSFKRLKLDLLTRIDIQFLRFFGGNPRMDIRLEEIVWGGVEVDGIPALVDAAMIPAAQASHLTADEQVFGVEIGGDARAYPFRILDWHEMANDSVGGVPVALAYCTLCGAGILFDRRVPGREKPFEFGSSGLLYRSNKLMYDRETDSLWNQFTGRPVVGKLAGSGIELKQLPVTIASWRSWRERHPDTKVLAPDTGHIRDYAPGAAYGRYFASPKLMFPAGLADGRLAAKDQVFGVRAPAGAKAWPLDAFRRTPVINDRVGALDVVVIGDADERTGRAYRRDGREFRAGPGSDLLLGPGGAWRVTEEALVGPDGARLPRLAGHVAYWFAWASYLGPKPELYEPSR
ncbi:MAG: DUF3179 domain-containing protein [Rhodospirillales bacterium]